jgi:hypothetical protein
MAYMSQERKAELAPAIKAILKKYNITATIAVRHHMTLVLNIKKGPIDFGGDNVDVNPYWYQEHYKDRPEALAFLKEVIPAMMVGNHDRSDIQTDYFDVGWYIDVNIGQWQKPYQLVK